jgi:hypothetical protein
MRMPAEFNGVLIFQVMLEGMKINYIFRMTEQGAFFSDTKTNIEMPALSSALDTRDMKVNSGDAE